jgi:hypothetical protein
MHIAVVLREVIHNAEDITPIGLLPGQQGRIGLLVRKRPLE